MDFNASAEVALGNYQTADGIATLMLIAYPTPQLAAEHLRQIDAANPANPHAQAGGSTPLAGPIFAKRTGPMVVVATGAISPGEARALLSAVNYEADVTWNENTYQGKKNNLANLLLNVFMLIGILIVPSRAWPASRLEGFESSSITFCRSGFCIGKRRQISYR